jgi:hypothetical protein
MTIDASRPFRYSPLLAGAGTIYCVSFSGPALAWSLICGSRAPWLCRSSASVARRLADASPTPGLVRTAWLMASRIENGSAEQAGDQITTKKLEAAKMDLKYRMKFRYQAMELDATNGCVKMVDLWSNVAKMQ